eukprot:scaffold5854_cov78-Skeletonema_dohrnii-CCMP3373.AAC.1
MQSTSSLNPPARLGRFKFRRFAQKLADFLRQHLLPKLGTSKIQGPPDISIQTTPHPMTMRAVL